ncbi:SusC/RagA family TonB-linked outer membrane protein [Pedobacter frigidisoli]|uniref:SusC/RagA family TonB-linked outer membrane protein n=1 Tax=Pedobacter frigidisoli TaxID=2530455 RepID=UPI0013F17750|nr:SusC/RagA family TonB-linked outer membrane protein [Pedobacter frigidisoli]
MLILLTTSLVRFSNAQTITLKVNQSSLRSILNKIEQQSGYDFWYNKGAISETEKISVDVKGQPLDVVLKIVFAQKKIGFEIVDKTIFLKPLTENPKGNPTKTETNIEGYVVDDQGKPIPNATIKVKGGDMMTIANGSGRFKISTMSDNGILIATSLGYSQTEIPFSFNNRVLNIILQSEENRLEDVQIVSTGYQNIPKERATGSFTQIDNSLINRSVGQNILDRLDGITNSLIFNKTSPLGTGASSSTLSIRGRSTIMGNPNPLIILDNFPYQGDLSNINPNDIESITVLKDAAAASIWGTLAGNGVIVINTKKGKLNQKVSVNLNANIKILEKANLTSQKQLTSAEYIEVERDLFDKGKFNSTINNGYGNLSPAVEIMLSKRLNNISEARMIQMLDSLSRSNATDQFLKYFYREPVSQQYQLSLDGGSAAHQYFISAGLDQTLGDRKSTSNNRKSLNINQTFYLLNGKMDVVVGLALTQSQSGFNSRAYNPRYPYENVTNESGIALAVTDGILRLPYAQSAGNGKLLDWLYRPLNDDAQNSTGKTTDYRLNTQLSYQILKSLKMSANYLYQQGITFNEVLDDQNSYYVRQQVNTLSSINTTTGLVSRPLPFGDILSRTNSGYHSNFGRIQFIYSKSFGESHELNGILGGEVRENIVNSSANILYGYNRNTQTSLNQFIDFSKFNNYFYNTTTSQIQTGIYNYGTVDRNRSIYGNLDYSYLKKYHLSLSARKDESNIFGVKSNQKGVPLWSAGTSWLISSEEFYPLILPKYLRFRSTYGYNGNSDQSTSAYLTASIDNVANIYGQFPANIQNPPNPSLVWEKIANLNLGLDFATKGNRISGSIEFYLKNAKDLIGYAFTAPQTGITQYRGNSASLKTKGWDFSIQSINTNGKIKWRTSLLVNFVRDRITAYGREPASNSALVISNTYTPIMGYPVYSIFSYPTTILDNAGNPQGYLNNVVSKDYTGMANSNNRSDLVYHGSGNPTVFGSLINTIGWKKFEFSFNLTFKGGYYFRRNSLNNTNLYNNAYNSTDYANRWMKVGDEFNTYVPSLVYPAIINRTNLFTYSDKLVERGDHLRFKDVRIGYTLNNPHNHLGIHQLSFFGYASNLGIIWRANKYGIDPDSQITDQQRGIAFGLKVTF